MTNYIKEIKKPAVLLDLDDTILDFHAAERVAVSQTLMSMGVEPTDKTVSRYSEINRKHWEQLELGMLTREQVLVGRFDRLFEELGIQKSGADAREIYENLLKIGHYFVPGAEKLLDQIHDTYDLYIVSNGSAEIQESRLNSAGIKKYFKNIFISEEIGYDKPSLEFFSHCFAAIPNFERECAIIVGDSLSSDIRGGINAGVTTCWFNPEHKLTRNDIIPDYQISKLDELPPLLGKLF